MVRASGGILLVVLLVVGLAGASKHSFNQLRQDRIQDQIQDYDQEYDQELQAQNQPQPFEAGKQYVYSYDSQISTGIDTNGLSSSERQQLAVTRVKAMAVVSVKSAEKAVLQLEKVRFGQLDGEMEQPEQIQSFGMFKPKKASDSRAAQLVIPCQFQFQDGRIKDIQFHEQDSSWSMNIKRAVLNLMQVNFGRNQQQQHDEEGQEEQSQEQNNNENDGSKPFGFKLQEETIEGVCPVTYTVYENSPICQEPGCRQQQEQREQGGQRKTFNVTKSIDFKRCKRTADVFYGYQNEQPKCEECNNKSDKQQKQSCQQQCQDSKQQQQQREHIDRSTVYRFTVVGESTRFDWALKRAEVVSQYVQRALKAQNTEDSSASLRTIAVGQLVFRRVQDTQEKNNEQQQQIQQLEQSEKCGLLFDNSWNEDEKQFYMEGDEEFGRNSPFANVPHKVEQAQNILQNLVAAVSEKSIEFEKVAHLQRLVEVLRMCSTNELKEILAKSPKTNEAERRRAREILANSLANAATRNTLQILKEQITEGELDTLQALQALKSLNAQIAPSDRKAAILMQLCQDEQVRQSGALKQACWFTFGSMLHSLCKQNKKTNSAIKTEQCGKDKLNTYKQVLLEQYNAADSIYEKVVALKAIGNAGIAKFTPELEQIIKDREEEASVRVTAMNALRRTSIPRSTQRSLLGVFQHTREQPAVRAAALVMILQSAPQEQTVDQVMYTLIKERQEEMRGYVYSVLVSLAKSRVPQDQQIAKHLQKTLKLANIDEQTLPKSGKMQASLFNEKLNEGVVLNLASMFNSRSAIPAHLTASLDTFLNDNYGRDTIRISAIQTGAERWFDSLMEALFQNQQQSNKKTRGSRRSNDFNPEQEMNNLKEKLNLQPRQPHSRDGKAYMMICVRVGDVDQFVLPLDEQTMPSMLKQALRGEKVRTLAELVEKVGQQLRQVRIMAALNGHEKTAKIGTSVGVVLRAQEYSPIMASIDGNFKFETAYNDGMGLKASIRVQPVAAAALIQKMECWTPILITGASSTQSVESSMPLNVEMEKGDEIKITLDTQDSQTPETRLLGIHTLPTTYSADWDERTQKAREAKLNTIRPPQLEQLQRDVDTTLMEQGRCGTPIRINGHYHRPERFDYPNIVQVLMATENHLHVSLKGKQDEQLQVRIQAGVFESVKQQEKEHGPEFGGFYSRFQGQQQQDQEDYEEDYEQNGHQFNTYLKQYRSGQVFYHWLKISAENNKQCKAEVKVRSYCDEKHTFCKAHLDAQRTPIYANEMGGMDWKLNSKVQVWLPDTVTNVQQLQMLKENNNKNSKFRMTAEAEWGTTHDNRQSLKASVEGKNVLNRAQKNRIEEQYDGAASARQQKQAAFINKYTAAVEYKLKPEMQNMANRAMDYAKSIYFWNTNTKLSTGPQGKAHCTLVIDPITRKHANLSISTPNNQVNINSIRMPISARPFPLVSRQSGKRQSVQQFLGKIGQHNHAQCSVDGRIVNTFDSSVIGAPISECWSVVAADCRNSQYFVLIKADRQNREQKKIRVLTKENVMECQSVPQGNNGRRLQCTLNGENVHYNDQTDQSLVEYSNEEQTEAILTPVQGVSVRFGCWCNECSCQKVWITVSQNYKNSQCGLCGHYNNDDEDDLRMSNNQPTSDLAAFHRSYSIQDGECSSEDQQQMYEPSKKSMYKHFGLKGQLNKRNKKMNQRNQQQDQQYRAGHYSTYSSASDEINYGERDQNEQQQQEPIEQTKVTEYNHKICFSTKPVKTCPEGTYENEMEEQEKKVQSVCLSRHQPETREMLKQVRRGEVLNVSDRSPSLVEAVSQPRSCSVY